MKKDRLREKLFIYAVKLTKRLVIQSCQVVNGNYILNVFDEYKLWKQYHNPYLTIDHPNDRKKKDE